MVIYLYDQKIADVDHSQSLWMEHGLLVTVKQVNNEELEFTSNYCFIYFTTHHLSRHPTGLTDDRLERTMKIKDTTDKVLLTKLFFWSFTGVSNVGYTEM